MLFIDHASLRLPDSNKHYNTDSYSLLQAES